MAIAMPVRRREHGNGNADCCAAYSSSVGKGLEMNDTLHAILTAIAGLSALVLVAMVMSAGVRGILDEKKEIKHTTERRQADENT